VALRTIILLLTLSPLALAQQLTISPASLPDAGVGNNYYVELHASGGTAPYAWKLSGALPDGLAFDSNSATFTGIPAKAGSYRFTVTLTDAGRRSASRSFTLRVNTGDTIQIAWTKPPLIAGGAVSGEVEISNPGSETFDVTFIAVAVSENGRATALGYQRFNLGKGKQRIPFGSTLPRGTYVVHADAVGEIARTLTIRRARLQSPLLLVP